ncbi:MAG TPA: SdpI family protein, partial [Longimicrobium sp.]|nr:SdpI family protein [Longimicrobium sp.]
VVIAGMWVLALLVYLRSPGRVPMHWNVRGEIDGWGAPWTAFLLPATATGIVLLIEILPRLDPRRPNWAKFAGEVRVVVNVLVMFTAWLELSLLGGWAFGWKLGGGRALLAAMGVLLMVIGNYLPRIRSNWWMGIRTPWTLSSDRVWRDTHRLGGRTFVAAGAVSVLAAVLLPEALGVNVAIAAVLAGSLVPAVFSYLAWRREAAGRA